MFDSLADKFLGVFDRLRGMKNISAKDLEESFNLVWDILVEADVSVDSAERFLQQIRGNLLGEAVIKGVSSSDMIIKLINDELVKFLGGGVAELQLPKVPTVIMMVGLQGSGKTTSAAKLAYYLWEHLQKKALLVSLDTYRPAAREQLEILAQQHGLASLPINPKDNNPLDIAKQALKATKKEYYDVIILDTAGRLQVNAELMEELVKLEKLTEPTEILLVCDSLMGQEAVHVAQAFKETVKITGVILTRLDSDSKGGAAISLTDATGCPIKFIGEGEKLEDLQVFDPKRMASRILGMGDIVSLVEKAQAVITEDEAKKLQKKLQEGSFDLNDFLKQLHNLRKMGGMSTLLKLIPGMSAMKERINSLINEEEIARQEAMILSMTLAERSDPEILNSSRKRRIAQGSGTNMQELNHLLKKFKDAKRVAGKLSGNMDMEGGGLEKLLGGGQMGGASGATPDFNSLQDMLKNLK